MCDVQDEKNEAILTDSFGSKLQDEKPVSRWWWEGKCAMTPDQIQDMARRLNRSGINPGTWPPTPVGTMRVALDPAHAHTTRKYKIGNQTFWCVEGPDGYHRGGYHQEAEAAAVAAFWSGDKAAAEEHRKAFLVQRGMVKEEA